MRFSLDAAAKPARSLFRKDQEYELPVIVRRASEAGFKVTRPNGDTRIRGSRRLVIKSGNRDVAWLSAVTIKEERVVRPVPIAMVRGSML